MPPTYIARNPAGRLYLATIVDPDAYVAGPYATEDDADQERQRRRMREELETVFIAAGWVIASIVAVVGFAA